MNKLWFLKIELPTIIYGLTLLSTEDRTTNISYSMEVKLKFPLQYFMKSSQAMVRTASKRY